MIALLMALSGTAHAFELGLYGGGSWVANDPFVFRRGLQVGVEFAPNRLVSVGTLSALYPSLNQNDWSHLTTQLVSELHISPDISRIISRHELNLRVTPLRWEGERVETRVGALGGVGMVRTNDDLEALQAEGDPIAMATAVQWHATGVYGLTGELRGEWVGVRLNATRVTFIETVNSGTLEFKGNRFMSVEGTLWLF
ncbi:MAG: hypothetical protein H6739_10525 [Alphaproteobacteria bacterium]|nr:hypothetical protein [Alphaproteobacteria bacterium]